MKFDYRIYSEILKKACKNLDFKYKELSKNKFLIKITKENKDFFFLYNFNPLNSLSVGRIFRDKAYTYELLEGKIKIPKFKSYFDPALEIADPKFKSIEKIYKSIIKNFSLPVIIKMNSGLGGKNIFLCRNQKEIINAIKKITNQNSKDYDFMFIAQEFIKIKKEYRSILIDGKLELNYLKDNSKATFQGNLSPLHWKNAKAVLINDKKLNNQIEKTLKPIFKNTEIKFGGFDIALNENNELYVLEINSQPGFLKFIKDNGIEEIVKLYEKILLKL